MLKLYVACLHSQVLVLYLRRLYRKNAFRHCVESTSLGQLIQICSFHSCRLSVPFSSWLLLVSQFFCAALFAVQLLTYILQFLCIPCFPSCFQFFSGLAARRIFPCLPAFSPLALVRYPSSYLHLHFFLSLLHMAIFCSLTVIFC